jgi:hypothetical protein
MWQGLHEFEELSFEGQELVALIVVVGRSTTLGVWFGVDNTMMEELWVSTKLAAGCASSGVEQRCKTTLALVDSY